MNVLPPPLPPSSHSDRVKRKGKKKNTQILSLITFPRMSSYKSPILLRFFFFFRSYPLKLTWPLFKPKLTSFPFLSFSFFSLSRRFTGSFLLFFFFSDLI